MPAVVYSQLLWCPVCSSFSPNGGHIICQKFTTHGSLKSKAECLFPLFSAHNYGLNFMNVGNVSIVEAALSYVPLQPLTKNPLKDIMYKSINSRHDQLEWHLPARLPVQKVCENVLMCSLVSLAKYINEHFLIMFIKDKLQLWSYKAHSLLQFKCKVYEPNC